MAVGPLWTGRTAPDKIVRLARLVRSSAARVDAEYVASTRWAEDLALRVAADGVHPNDAGHRLLAQRITATLS